MGEIWPSIMKNVNKSSYGQMILRKHDEKYDISTKTIVVMCVWRKKGVKMLLHKQPNAAEFCVWRKPKLKIN